MDVSKNSGTPKSSILIGFSIINHPFWVTPIFGNTHMKTFPNSSKLRSPAVPGWSLLVFRSQIFSNPTINSKGAVGVFLGCFRLGVRCAKNQEISPNLNLRWWDDPRASHWGIWIEIHQILSENLSKTQPYHIYIYIYTQRWAVLADRYK